jgi:cytochrome c oxidase subunit IV
MKQLRPARSFKDILLLILAGIIFSIFAAMFWHFLGLTYGSIIISLLISSDRLLKAYNQRKQR